MANDHAYSAVWREGTGAQFWRVGLAFDALQIEDVAFMAQGLRMSLLRGGGDRKTAVWRAGSGEVFWHTGLDADEFKHKDTHFFNQGLRLVSLDVEDNFTAVWRPGSGEQHWASGLTFDEFKAKDLHFFNAGLRLVTMGQDNDNQLYGLWRPGSGHQHWLVARGGDANKQFERENQKQFDAGLRLLAFTGSAVNAVWRAATDSQAVRSVVNFHDLKKADEEYFKLGMRLVDLDEFIDLA